MNKKKIKGSTRKSRPHRGGGGEEKKNGEGEIKEVCPRSAIKSMFILLYFMKKIRVEEKGGGTQLGNKSILSGMLNKNFLS